MQFTFKQIFGSGQRTYSVQEVIDNGGEAVHAVDYANNGQGA
jgi:hypothetical protein